MRAAPRHPKTKLMGGDRLDYPALVERAMRGVVRDAMAQAAESGLPGEHHFYITFDTAAPGVDMAPILRAQYPEEMTIVLQHKFDELVVDDEAFAVTLSFGGLSQRLHVPFEAITGFADPSVNFGFKFDAGEPAHETDAEPAAEPPPATVEGDAEVVALDAFRKKP